MLALLAKIISWGSCATLTVLTVSTVLVCPVGASSQNTCVEVSVKILEAFYAFVRANPISIILADLGLFTAILFIKPGQQEKTK